MDFTQLFDKNTVINEKPDEGLESFQKDFWISRKAEILEVAAALEEKSYNAVLKVSHNWKGYSQPYGFLTLGELAKDLESAAKIKNHSECLNLLKNIELYLDLKKDFLGL